MTSAPERGSLLLIGQDRRFSSGLIEALQRKGFQAEHVEDLSDAVLHAAASRFDAALLSLEPDISAAVEACEGLRAERPLLPVLVLASDPKLDGALAAMRAGAYDYLTWPLPVDALVLTLDRAMAHRKLRREVRRLQRELNPSVEFGDIIGESPAMRSVFSLLHRVKNKNSSVLLTGETGTGKEVVARALHAAGKRAAKPFVAVDCAAIPEGLLESELFGHAKGAFTDARQARRGLFQQADGGTLFLDELGEMPLSFQSKLLRALQGRRVRPVGSDQEVEIDVRLIAATNRDLEAMAAEGTFREDLFYRVNVIHLELPPLRSRAGDVLLLAHFFIDQICRRLDEPVPELTDEAAHRLVDYPWPGNIRELENAIERAIALCSQTEIVLDDLPARVRGYEPQHVLVAAGDPEELVTLRTMEERYVRRVLAAVQGRRGEAARILGIDRKSLYRKMLRFGMAAESEGS